MTDLLVAHHRADGEVKSFSDKYGNSADLV